MKAEKFNVELLPELAFAYGKALVEQGSDVKAWREGLSLLKKFVIASGKDSEFYTQALRLLLTAEVKLKEAELQMVIEEGLPEIRRRINAQMVQVEGGSFNMGCTPEQALSSKDEKPAHRVQIATFEIGSRR